MGLFLFLVCPSSSFLQAPLPADIINDVYIDRTVELTPSLLQQAESTYLRLSNLTDVSDEQCEQLNAAKALIALTWMLPLNSNFYPSILEDDSQHCPSSNVAVQLILANAYHEHGEFDTALAAYWKVINNPTDAWLGITAHFNLIAAHNALGNIDSAIVNAEHLLKKAESSQPFRDKSMYQHLQINLAGLYNSNFEPQKALHILASTDTTGFTPYWNAIFSINTLLANKSLFRQSACDVIWNQHLRTIPFEDLPKRSVNEILSQALLSRDFVYFQRLRANEEKGIFASLQQKESPYAELLSPDVTEEQFIKLWDEFVANEERFIRLGLNKRAAEADHEQELDRVLTELARSKSKNSSWQHLFLLMLSTAVIALVTTLLLVRMRKSRLKAELNSVLAFKEDPEQQPVMPLTPNDVRILGDAITYGKRVSDALLVLKKLNVNAVNDTASVRDVNWAKVDRSNVLKKNEKEILEYIVMDFEAKEIARILNCSVSHIYNMRSRIRQALDISADAQIKDWVLERMA